MISRYTRPEIGAVWTDDARMEAWRRVEVAACEEMQGPTPADLEAIRAATFTVEAVKERERVLDHDVAAFVDVLSASAGAQAGRWIHYGLTSSDVVDTALALQVAAAGRLLLARLATVERAAWELAQRHRRTPCVGRTHGVHAEPMTFGLKALVWSEELGRNRARLGLALEGMAVGKLSGAVGTLAHLDPEVEARALGALGLAPEPVANQVVQRDRHAALLATLAVAAGTLEKIALEIRHLQRTEVREVEEPFHAGQRGSSAMPHKRNPVACERVCGLARLVRGYAQAAFENQALWHERDISHSSVERVILPDAFLVLDFMAAEIATVLSGLRIDAERMRRNLEAGGGLVFSQRVLLALVESGWSRDEAYRVVQRHAAAALDGTQDFRASLAADPSVAAALPGARLAECFALEPFLKSVDAIFSRATAVD